MGEDQRQRWGIVGGAVLGAVALVAGYFALPADPEPSAAQEREARAELDPDPDATWDVLGDPPLGEDPDLDGRAAASKRWGPGGRPGPGRWRERWNRAVEIVPLGPEEPTLGPDAVRAQLRVHRPALRRCIDAAGGFTALRRARRDSFASAGPRPIRGRRGFRARVSFDVGANGAVLDETIHFTPPMPAPFDSCFRAFFGAPEFEGVGTGVRVELPMGGRRRRGWDGGMPERRPDMR